MSSFHDMVLAEKFKPWIVLHDGRVFYKENSEVSDFIHSTHPSTYFQGRKTLHDSGSIFSVLHSPVKGKGVVLSDHLCNVPYDSRNIYQGFKPGLGC